MSRTSRRRNTKTKAISLSGRKGNALKSRYSRTWKRDGKYQVTPSNPDQVG